MIVPSARPTKFATVIGVFSNSKSTVISPFEVLKIASQYNPDLVNSTSYEDVLKDLGDMKDKAMRWEIIVSSFKPEPELFPVRQTLAEARARQAEQRQGQL